MTSKLSAPNLSESALGIALIGASATGKSTLAAWLCDRALVDMQPTITTRPRRTSEQADEPRDHVFVSQKRFDKLSGQNALAVRRRLYGYDYAVPRLRACRLPLLVLKPSFIEPLQASYPNFKVYQLEASEATVRARMSVRGQDQADINERLRQYALETSIGRRLADCIFCNEGPLQDLFHSVRQQLEADVADHALMLQ